MMYRLLADATLILHFGFILFVVLGGLLLLWWRRVMWLHIPAAAWGALIEFMNWPCPLTPLEKYLRRRADGDVYEGSFIEHYVGSMIYPGELSRGIEITLGITVVLLNVGIYWWVLRRRRKQGGRHLLPISFVRWLRNLQWMSKK